MNRKDIPQEVLDQIRAYAKEKLNLPEPIIFDFVHAIVRNGYIILRTHDPKNCVFIVMGEEIVVIKLEVRKPLLYLN